MKICIRAAVVAAVALGVVSGALAQKKGEDAPDIEFKDVANEKAGFQLSKYKGRIILMFFWRTTDSASLDAIPRLNKIYKTYSKNGVVVIGLTPEAREKVESVIKGKEIAFPVAFGGDQPNWKVAGFPKVYLINTRFRIEWIGGATDNLEEIVKEQLRRDPPAGSSPEDLRARLSKARKLHDSKEYGKAYTLVKSVADLVEGDSAVTELLKRIQEDAKKWFEEAKEAVKAKEFDKACPILAELSVRFAGEDWAKDVDAEISRVQGERDGKAKMRKALDNARGALRNDQAADLEAIKQYLEARNTYKDVVERYPDTDAAKAAQAAIDRITGDASIQKAIDELTAEEEANRWLDLADRYARCEMYPEAREYYQKVISTHPKSSAAGRAKDRLLKLPKEQASAGGEGQAGGDDK